MNPGFFWPLVGSINPELIACLLAPLILSCPSSSKTRSSGPPSPLGSWHRRIGRPVRGRCPTGHP